MTDARINSNDLPPSERRSRKLQVRLAVFGMLAFGVALFGGAVESRPLTYAGLAGFGLAIVGILLVGILTWLTAARPKPD